MLRRHLLQANEEEARTTLACECGFVAASKRDLVQHLKFHRAGPELKLFCELCSFVTDCESRLKRHMLVHSKKKPFQCSYCEYRGTQREHVVRHMRFKHGVEVPKVRRRKKAITPAESAAANDPESSNQVVIETGEHPTGTNKEEQITIISFDEVGQTSGSNTPSTTLYQEIKRKKYPAADFSKAVKSFACSQCTMTFSKLLNLYKHLQGQHGVENPGVVDGQHSCLVCDYHTGKKANLLVHMRKHNPASPDKVRTSFNCMICRFGTHRRQNLYYHMSRKHNMHLVTRNEGTYCNVSEPGQTSNLSIIPSSHSVPGPQTDTQRQTVMVQMAPDFPLSEVVIDTPPRHSSDDDAAEAIEGLTALAGHAPQPITATETTSEASASQLMELATGDLIEIDGEVYKVEISPADS